MKNLRVAVVGAGPAGCMLARLLHLGGLNVTVTVFEGEGSLNSRTQGGTLDLHTGSGLAALREAGLWAEFKKHARYDGQYMAIVDKNLDYHIVRGVDDSVLFGEQPEIDRVRLREILSESPPEGTVKWGHRLQKVEDRTLVFANNIAASGFDLIIGADGAWSKIRQAIAPGLQPVYSQVAMQELSIPDAQTAAPDVYKLVNRGTVFASAPGQRVVLQQMGNGSIQIYAGFVRENPDWMKPNNCGYDVENIDEAKEALAKEFADWCPQLRDAFNRAQGKSAARSLFRLPVGSRWEHRPGFTLIGDAAHLMTPHAGEGVNQALGDAMMLARAILEAKSAQDLDEQIRGFEEDMRARAATVQQLSYDLCLAWMFAPDAPRSAVAALISRHRKAAQTDAEAQTRAKSIAEAMAQAQAKNRA